MIVGLCKKMETLELQQKKPCYDMIDYFTY